MKRFIRFKTLLLLIVLLVESENVSAQYTGVGIFTKITALVDLTDGYYVITNSGDTYAMNNTHHGTYLENTKITPSGGNITNPVAAIVWKIETNSGGRTIYNETSAKYVSFTGSSNNVQVVDMVSTNNQRWTFAYVSGAFSVSNVAVSTRMLQYYSGSPRFVCYTSAQQKLLLYKLGEAPSNPTIAIAESNIPAFSSEVDATDLHTITVNGGSLTGNISLAVTGTDAAQFTLSSTSFAPTDGTVTSQSVTITYTPTVAGSHTAALTLSSDGAESVVMNLSGVATWIPLSAPVVAAASGIASTYFAANWGAVVGATAYELNVYTKEGSVESATDLFISEYIKGSSNNKYIEIYNGTGSLVDLSDYKLELYPNSGTVNPSVTLSGILANGAVKVYKNSAATLTLPDEVTAENNGAVNYNGDDAIALYKISTTSFVDIFGRIGDDPGTAWTGEDGYTTVDKTLRRKSSVTEGITVSPTGTGSFAFTTLTTEWDLYDIDNVANLGAHTYGSQTITPIPGSPFTVTGETTKAITGLSTGTTYYYTVVAKNANVTSLSSNEVAVPTLITSVSEYATNKSITAYDGKIRFLATDGERVQVYNTIGQQLINRMAVDGLNTILVNTSGMLVVKVGNCIAKVML